MILELSCAGKNMTTKDIYETTIQFEYISWVVDRNTKPSDLSLILHDEKTKQPHELSFDLYLHTVVYSQLISKIY